MCGIFIVINKKSRPVNIKQCKIGLNNLIQRGPDWSFYKQFNKNIFFGQTVLSMTGRLQKDITQHYSFSKNFFLLLNGEIYNYKDIAKDYLDLPVNQNLTDTKVLTCFFDRKKADTINSFLDGMYAYAVYCKNQNKIIISRDPQGEKILYKFEDSKEIVISSEVNAIIKYLKKGELDSEVLKTYFYTRHFSLFNKTIFKNIEIIEPGAVLSLDLKSYKFKKISNVSLSNLINERDYKENSKKNENDLVEELHFLFKKNLKEMVPLGRKYASIISGGIDSSLITGYLAKFFDPDKLVFLNHVGKDLLTDYIQDFEKIINFKISRYDIRLQDYYENLLKSLRICNSPIHSHSFVGQLIISEKVAKKKCRALFGGEGADELFGGYETYRQKIKNYKINNSDYTKLLETQFLKKTKEFYEFNNKLIKNWKTSLSHYDFIKNKDEQYRQSMMLMDTLIQLSSNGLRGSDLMAMNYSVESRSLFLRKDIVKFALNLPIKFKINYDKDKLMNTKYLLKKVFLKIYPKKLILKKQGFAGFPNETKKFLKNNHYVHVKKLLKIKNLERILSTLNRANEWKIINTETYLSKISKVKF